MNRRELLLTVAAAAAVPANAVAQPAHGALREAAREAYIFTLPLIEMSTTRERVMSELGSSGLQHMRALATPVFRTVTAPNNDTLFSMTWIDTAKGPVTLVLPPTGRRYISMALMDMYTNNFAILGTRNTGEAGGRFTLIGPDAERRDPAALRSPTRWVWLLTRVLIDGPADLPAAHAVQDALRVEGWRRSEPLRTASRSARWQDYFRSAQALMLENPPPATDERILRRMAPLGVTRAGGFDAARFNPQQEAEIAAGVEEARRLLRPETARGRVVQGWTYPSATLGDFRQEYLQRARVAQSGLAALPPQETLYMRAVGPDGRHIHSGGTYRLRFPPGQTPPVDGFWSLTIYEPTEDGQFFLSANPLARYSIGDRTPGLKRDADGALEIWISHADLGPERRANWLPAPDGPFTLHMRTYLPRPELVDGRYRLPAVERVG